MITPQTESNFSHVRPIGLHAILGVVALVAVAGLLLVAFYKPFPAIVVLNAADHPLQNVELQTFGSETHGETHDLGTLEVGETREVTVRSYEATVLGLTFEINGKVIEHTGDPLPITQGQMWRITVGREGTVTGVPEY